MASLRQWGDVVGASFFCSHPEKAGPLCAEQTTALRTAAAELEPFPGIACALRLRRGALRAGSGAEGVLPGLFPAVRRTTQAGRRFPVLSAQGRYAGLRVHCFGSAAERLRRSADARVIFSLSCAAAPRCGQRPVKRGFAPFFRAPGAWENGFSHFGTGVA